MDSHSGGAGVFSFLRRKAGLNGGTARARGPQNPIGTDSLPITTSDFLLLPAVQQGEPPRAQIAQAGPAYIGKGCQIIGQSFFEGSIRIDGQVEGTICASDRIAVGQSGTIITANPIKAAEVIIEGTVRGNIVASERIEICASADVVGDLHGPIIAVAAGAVIEGCCSTPRQNGLFRFTNQVRIAPSNSEKG